MTLSDVQLFGVFVGSWVILIALTMFALHSRPGSTAKGLPATFAFMGLVSFLSMLSRGSLWMALTVAAMPVLGIYLVRVLMRRRDHKE